jgi:hypothetical protein
MDGIISYQQDENNVRVGVDPLTDQGVHVG